MIHRHALSMLVLLSFLGMSPALQIPWGAPPFTPRQDHVLPVATSLGQAHWCRFLGDMAALHARSRDEDLPLYRIIQMRNESYWTTADRQALDDMAREIYATTWDEATARREIEARCLAQAPR